VEDETFLVELTDELSKLEFYEKNNDLYKFHQSGDLKATKSPYISALRVFLYERFREWVQDVTGLSLTMTMDMNCARYDYTDILLCHDDMLEGRRIAYILYLVPTWNECDGGTLDVYNSNENGDPSTIAHSLLPEWNKLVFFEVGPYSFHQVAEVLTEDKTRLSISGWFYGDQVEYPPKFRSPPHIMSFPITVAQQTVYDWINPAYLDSQTQIEIREKFEDGSEVELVSFLIEDKYKAVAASLQEMSLESQWQMRGPMNKRQYEVGNTPTWPSIVQECMDLLSSEAMFLILSNITGLTLHELAVEKEETDESSEDEVLYVPQSKRAKETQAATSKSKRKVDATCFCEVRRWKHGAYTLLHDNDDELSGFALDATLFFNCKDWQNEYGGYISYLAKDEDEELLTVYPFENSLALVFRDKETLRFVKHINHKSNSLGNESHYHTISTIYHEE